MKQFDYTLKPVKALTKLWPLWKQRAKKRALMCSWYTT